MGGTIARKAFRPPGYLNALPSLPSFFRLHPQVQMALAAGAPVVALESTVITHGLPYPENLDLAQDMEQEVRQTGAIPATIGVLDGLVRLGLDGDELERLARSTGLAKISGRDFASAVVHKSSGGTTVAATLVAA